MHGFDRDKEYRQEIIELYSSSDYVKRIDCYFTTKGFIE